jgi:hypothetical protein
VNPFQRQLRRFNTWANRRPFVVAAVGAIVFGPVLALLLGGGPITAAAIAAAWFVVVGGGRWAKNRQS